MSHAEPAAAELPASRSGRKASELRLAHQTGYALHTDPDVRKTGAPGFADVGIGVERVTCLVRQP